MRRRIVGLEAHDIRFPTSRLLDGSDAVHKDPDYSVAYVILQTDLSDGLEGHGFCFTAGRGTEVEVAAIYALWPLVRNVTLGEILTEPRAFARRLVQDTQLRWLGPEKGVLQMAAAAIINAVWDLAAKVSGKPLWKYLSDLAPDQLVKLVDFQYLTDVLTEDEALDMLARSQKGKSNREARLIATGYPAYATSPGWLGYPDEKMIRLAKRAVDQGFRQIKLKVGGALEDDKRRLRLAREAVGPNIRLATDANQKWDVAEAIEWMAELAVYEPYWIEEPTCTDDILGHAAIRKAVAPIKVTTGEVVQNRVMFKQLLQAQAVDILQIDATRVAGVNENIANLLLAAKFGVPVCPHAGGVGLCELVQHLAMLDYLAISTSTENRVIEYLDHLHEHFEDPVELVGGRYRAPMKPGFSAEMKVNSRAYFQYPNGPEWTAAAAAAAPLR
jgi:L-fuconate dehydratase